MTRKLRKDLENIKLDEKVSEFLNIQCPRTKAAYQSYFKIIFNHYHETGTQMLKGHKLWSKKILALQQQLLADKYSPSSVQSILGCLRSFFSSNKRTLDLSKQDLRKLNRRARNSQDYHYSQGDIKKMLGVANLKEQWVLAGGISFGLRSEDFVTLTYGRFRNALRMAEAKKDLEPPVDCGILETQKEVGVKAHLFLSSDALPVIKALLEANGEAQDSDRVYKEEPTELSYIMRQLFKRAGLNSGTGDDKLRVRFHPLRGFLFSALSSMASMEYAKAVVGKKINGGDETYLDERKLRGIYERAMPNIVVSSNGMSKKLTAIEEENKTLREELAKLNTKVEGISTEKQAVLADLRGLNTDQLKALMSMADQFNQKKRKEPKVEVDIPDKVQKEVKPE
jgi:hypothetical protein